MKIRTFFCLRILFYSALLLFICLVVIANKFSNPLRNLNSDSKYKYQNYKEDEAKENWNNKEQATKSFEQRWVQDIKPIETLQWAVKIKAPISLFKNGFIKKVNKPVSIIAKELDLENIGNIENLKDWYLFEHRDHNHTSKTLQQVYSDLHHSLPLQSVASDISDLNNSKHNYKVNVLKSTTDFIKSHYHKQLELQHNVSESSFKSLVESINKRIANHPDIERYHHQIVRFRQKRSLHFDDPAFPNQWHLVNRYDSKMDINVTGVWEAGYTGKGITVCVIDDGMEWTNPDLYPNFSAKGSWDLNDNDADPMPDLSKPKNHHGTRCAGEIAAKANNVCAVGVAFGSLISCLRVLDGPMTDVMEATAFTKAMDINAIYSCSWGPEDDGKTVDGPDFLASEGLRHGVDFGRGGYGSLYVVASGNGGLNQDNCNFDGYANSIYTITIGAVDEVGSMPYYAEECASMLAVTFSSGNGMTRNIVTTDWTKHSGTGCTSDHTGTSAAAPLAAGIAALALEANPCLSWRDIQYLIILSAVKVDIDVAHWNRNAAGLHHSHKHGFGLMNAWRMVNAAKVWETVPWLTTFATRQLRSFQQIPLHKQPLDVTYTVTEEDLSGFNLYMTEHVQVQVWLTHVKRGDLRIVLTCPSKTQSVIADLRPKDSSSEGFSGWMFSTVRCWGEEPKGTYTLTIKDYGKSLIPRGILQYWRVKIHGTPIKPEEFQAKKKTVENSFSGAYLNKEAFEPKCEPPQETFHYNPVISHRWLKFLALTSIFCLFMGMYETFEYLFCYNDEKKEEARQRQLQNRAQTMSELNQASTAEYIPLENIDDQMSQIIMETSTSDHNWSCDLQMNDVDLGETSHLLRHPNQN